MKRLYSLVLMLIPALLWGQTKQETSAIMDKWKEIDRLISIKNYEQTKPLLADIKAHALKHKDDPMFVKAFLAESNVYRINNDEEKFFELGQAHFVKNIAASKSALVKSVLTNFYADFLYSNQYVDYSETKNSYLKKSRRDRLAFIDSLYRTSLLEKPLLLKQDLSRWAPILSEKENISLSPTLYHLLTYSYINFLSRNQSINSKERTTLIEELLAVSRSSKSADAISYLLSLNLSEKQFSSPRMQEKAYLKIIDENKSDYNAFLYFEVAQSYFWNREISDALRIIEKAKNEYPNSKWINSIKNLEIEILRPEIRIVHKKLEPSEYYTPFKLEHKNLKTLYIRVYKTPYSPKDLTDYKVNRDSISKLVTVNSKIVYEEQLELRQFDDFNTHSTIYKINPLSFGKYILLYSNNAEFKDDGVLLKVVSSNIQISDLFFSRTTVQEKNDEYRNKTFILNKKSGLPHANKKIGLYRLSDKKATLLQNEQSDKNGVIVHHYTDKNSKFRFEEHSLYVPEEDQFINLYEIEKGNFSASSVDNDDESETTGMILTDRKIYRPGQEIYFKTILYNNHSNKGRTLANEDFEVYLLDRQGQKVDSVSLKSNSFGSANGQLKIPVNTLNGQFRLSIIQKENQLAMETIRVEEYKRSTFKVSLDVNKETYTKKDSLVIRGKAEMLSGAPLIDAEVKLKMTVNGYGRTYKKINMGSRTVRTNSQGVFEFKIPLSHSELRDLERFTAYYTVDVVNQTGELQTAASHYSYSDKPWNLRIYVPSPQIEGRWNELRVVSSNPNNEFLPMKGQVRIYRTVAGKKVISEDAIRYFNEVEYLVAGYEDCERYFPYSFDKATLNKEVRKELIATYDFNTADTDIVKIDSQLMKRGFYHIEAISLTGEDSTRAEQFIYVLDEETKSYGDNTFLTAYTDKSEYNPGDKVTIHVRSKHPDAKNVLLLSSSANTLHDPINLSLKNGKGSYSYIANSNGAEATLNWSALFIVNNQIKFGEIPVKIKNTDKQILIKTVTFRDKITPGKKEKWSFNLTNINRKLESEVLATMYDASLNEFSELRYRNDFRLRENRYWINYYFVYNGFNQTAYNIELFPSISPFPANNNQLPVIKTYHFWGNDWIPFPSAIVYESEGIMDRAPVEGSITGSTKGVEGRDFKDVALYEELQDPNLLREVTEQSARMKAPNGEFGPKKVEDLDQVKARTNLQETAFFYPTLYSDAEGNVSFEFDSPEALTRWKLLLFAHGKNLEAGTASFFTQTQKELMVRPNLPRYFREGDEMTIKAQVQNLSDKQQDGQAKIQLINPVDNSDVTTAFLQEDAMKSFLLAKKNNQIVEWRIKVPASYPTIQVKIVAASAEFSDGEIQELAVLPNKVLILESEKVVLKANETKEFKLESAAKENLMAKVQVQSNPILEIISALDYLNHYPYECTEQSSSRWFGLKMVQYIGNHYPAIADYFKEIKAKETKSRLEENASLNELKMQEMPWLRDIQGDEKKLQALAELFNSNIDAELKQLESKLANAQLANGAFPWFEGGDSNTQISIRILEIFGKVLYLDKSLINAPVQDQMKRLTIYLDADSNIYKEKASAELALDYLYARHFWNGYFKLSKATSDKLNKKIARAPIITATGPAGLAAKAWIVNQLYGSGKEANELKNRIQQEAIFDKDKGTYWPSNEHYNSVSLHTYLVEAFKSYDPSKLMDITQWLYYKKEANSWRSTWMTVDAIYALLYANNPKDFAMENTVNVLVDGKSADMNNAVLGQVSKTFSVSELTSNKSIQIANNNDRTIYGGVYHQYFLPVEQVKANTNELRVSKQYMVERNGKWVETKEAKLGERIKVKITVVNDKPLQYVHLKDSRPAGVEPVYRPSGYQWRGSFDFTLKDASTNYFFDYLPKGTREYEYEVKANNIGLFNSGLSTIECMYDPTVNARSANVKLTIVE